MTSATPALVIAKAPASRWPAAPRAADSLIEVSLVPPDTRPSHDKVWLVKHLGRWELDLTPVSSAPVTRHQG